MSGLFSVPIGGLKEGHHTFDFEISGGFFDLFDESEIKEGNLQAIIGIEKGGSHIDMDIRISGSVRICCDRCLEMFNHTVECDNRLLIEFGTVRDESDPEILILPRDEYDLDLKQYFYEFIYLALPIRRMHPDDENGNSTCDPVMLKKLKEHLIDEEVKNDPRWDELRKLMNNN